MKTTGGLTRGRGISEKQRLVWLVSMPMQEFTGVQYNTSDQHKDMPGNFVTQLIQKR